MKSTILGLALTCACLSASTAHGSILSVDFNGARGAAVGATYSGNGVLRADGSSNDNPALGTTTGHWDGITFSNPNTPTPSSGLLNSSGQGTSATLAFANWAFQDNCPGCNYAQPGSNPADQSLLNDYLGIQNPAGNALPTLTIGGLSQNSPYTLYIYGTNGGSGAGGTWSVNGSAAQSATGNGPSPFSAFSSGNDYTKFSATSNALGQLVVTGSAGPNGNGYVILNGFQLSPSPAPEPASLVLCGLGTVGLFFAVRRRRSAK